MNNWPSVEELEAKFREQAIQKHAQDLISDFSGRRRDAIIVAANEIADRYGLEHSEALLVIQQAAGRPATVRKAKPMNFQDAITILATRSGDIDEARSVVTRAVLEIVGGRDDDGALGDWIAAGEYSGNETAQSIAAEWSE